MRVGIVDLGTNTCRLYLAEVEDGRVAAVAERVTTVVRLGQGVDASGELNPDAVARTFVCLEGYAPRLAAYGPARRLLIATSALRDAGGAAFLAEVRRRFALPTRVLGGDEEGTLAFRGGTAALSAAPLAGPVLLVDIGGGSTEFAAGVPGGPPAFVRSLDVGAVRLTERFFAADPPTPAQAGDARAHVRGLLARELPAHVRAGVALGVGVAGTYTTLVASKLGLRVYRPELVEGHELTLADMEAAVALFAGLTSAAVGRLPGIQPGREDVILAGALIAAEACRAFGLTAMRVSEADLLEGAALALADGSLAPA